MEGVADGIYPRTVTHSTTPADRRRTEVGDGEAGVLSRCCWWQVGRRRAQRGSGRKDTVSVIRRRAAPAACQDRPRAATPVGRPDLSGPAKGKIAKEAQHATNTASSHEATLRPLHHPSPPPRCSILLPHHLHHPHHHHPDPSSLSTLRHRRPDLAAPGLSHPRPASSLPCPFANRERRPRGGQRVPRPSIVCYPTR